MFGAGVSLIGIFFLLVVLSGLWTGLLGLRQAGRNGPWWAMFIALVCSTVAVIGPTILLFVVQSGPAWGSPSQIVAGLASVVVILSVLLFSLGFAMHGLKAARIKNRLEELEQLTTAMSSEIDRLREGGVKA